MLRAKGVQNGPLGIIFFDNIYSRGALVDNNYFDNSFCSSYFHLKLIHIIFKIKLILYQKLQSFHIHEALLPDFLVKFTFCNLTTHHIENVKLLSTLLLYVLYYDICVFFQTHFYS